MASHATTKTTPKGIVSGFTIIELLIVLATIAALIAMLLPAAQSSREAARRLVCANNFRQAGIAMHHYYDVNQQFPPGLVMWSSASKPDSCVPRPPLGSHSGFGWGAYILPFLEETDLRQSIDFQKNYFDAHSGNRRTIGHFVRSFLCPSDPQGPELVFCCGGWTNGQNEFENVGNTNIAGVADAVKVTCDDTWPKHFAIATGVLAERIGAKVSEIPDGLSKTFLLGEVTGAGFGTHLGNFWASWNVKSTSDGINGPGTVPGGYKWSNYLNSGFSGFHPNGCHFVMADGSVHFVSARIEAAVLAALTTRAGGESISLP